MQISRIYPEIEKASLQLINPTLSYFNFHLMVFFQT